ncbi:MAG: hypothetical protein JWN44_4777 [Myxococcales bacterium]|nr:hypothetical protein [Myxococcales bacterium]
MNKKPERKKLQLNKQTIRRLTNAELDTVNGGLKRVSEDTPCCGTGLETCTTGTGG